MKRKTKAILLSLFLTFAVYGAIHYKDVVKNANEVTSAVVIENKNKIFTENSSTTDVYFCPADACIEKLIYLVKNHDDIKCAFFALDNDDLESALKEKNAKLVIDNENQKRLNEGIEAVIDTSSQYSHNKFCVFDGKIVSTGSFNPADSESKNDNNVVVYYSEVMAKNYLDEFDELYSRKFGSGEKVKTPVFALNGHIIENYFCPEDNCADQIIRLINKSEKSIDFMYFSFTDDNIGNALLARKDQIKIMGVFEKQQNSPLYSEYQKLLDAGIKVRVDGNKYKMHNKVMIIDGKIVAFGSYNPTANGNKENDENLVIDHTPSLALQFEKEFERVYSLGIQ